MTPEKKLITVNGPVVESSQFQSGSTGIIYSVSLSNGLVVTSPEQFEALNHVSHKPKRTGKEAREE